MPYNFAADSFQTKKLCSRLSWSEVRFFYANRPFCVFRPPLGDLGATYDHHLGLIGKRVVDFLLALIELFFTRCYGWGATSDYQFKIGDFARTGARWPKISGRRGRPPTNHSSSQKTRLNFVRYKNLDRFFFRFVTIHACDRQADGRTDRILIAIPRLHYMQRGKNVKLVNNLVLSQKDMPQTHRTVCENSIIN